MFTDLSHHSEFWDWGVALHQLALASAYKYKPAIDQREKTEILEQLWRNAVQMNIPPVSAVMGVPPHLDSENSFPWELARHFAKQMNVPDLSWRMTETKRLGVKIKSVPIDDRMDLLDDIFDFDIDGLGYAPKGILILDDFYESGSTLETVCAYLKGRLPETRLAVMTMYAKRG